MIYSEATKYHTYPATSASFMGADSIHQGKKYLTASFTDSPSPKENKLIAQRRAYRIVPSTSSGLIYYSKKESLPLNGEASVRGQPVVCRHLAYAYAMEAFGTTQHTFNEIDSVQKIATHPAFQKNYHELYHQNLPKERYCFQLDYFPHTIRHLAEKYWDDISSYISAKNYLLYSDNHAMAIRFRRKRDKLIITFYDPNDTTRHRKVVLSDPRQTANLCFEDMLNEHLIRSYFPGKNPVGLICGTETVKFANQCTAHFFGVPSSSLLSFTLSSNMFGMSSAAGVEAINYVRQIIKSSHLSEEEKVQHLLAQKEEALPALTTAFNENNADAIMTFANEILNSNLSSSAKTEILQAKGNIGTSALYASFYGGKTSTIIEFCQMILKSSLMPEHKTLLLLADNQGIETGLSTAKAMGDTETVEKYTQLIDKSQLPQDFKECIFQASDKEQ